jgi:hypothetical protein
MKDAPLPFVIRVARDNLLIRDLTAAVARTSKSRVSV